MRHDRRRIGQGATLLLAGILVADALTGAPPALSQGFGWGYFGVPAQRRRSPRRRAPQRGEQQSPASDQAAVPLPVPRPHFPGDPPEHRDRPDAPPPAAPLAPPPAPPERAPGVDAAPLKSAKPELETPKPERPNPGSSKPELPKSTDTPPAKPIGGESGKPADATPADATPKRAGPTVSEPKAAEKVPSSGAPAPPVTGAPVPPAKPPDLAKPGTPSVAPSGARLGEQPGQPQDDPTCIDRLKTRNVAAEPIDIGPQPDDRCTVVHAVRLTGLSLPDGGKVEFPEHPAIACTTADSFSLYIRDLLSPLAKGTYGAPVEKVWTGPGLECRSRDHIFGAKLSAHGQGLAIDIAQVKLANGLMFEVGQPKTEIDKNFETAARAGGCGYFHTALGPGTDDYHRTHWHFDLEVRGAKGDTKYCR